MPLPRKHSQVIEQYPSTLQTSANDLGLKGPSALALADGFDLVDDVIFDVMHVLPNVIRNIFLVFKAERAGGSGVAALTPAQRRIVDARFGAVACVAPAVLTRSRTPFQHTGAFVFDSAVSTIL